ncbi:MAG: SDR family oxidoreductase [Chitinophagaceae bacterium]|nr:SDR family oxidoreductase [Chitinophagaceae bacterium]MBK9532889.1 SDR family oxidoreductase [Chitinophagaceae bacterium]
MNIVITGASKGLGKAMAVEFAQDKQGHHFFLCARHAAELEQTGKELQGRFPRTAIHTKTCDVGDKSSIREFATWINNLTGNIDILINNAGIYLPGSAYGEADGNLEKLMEVNTYSAYHLTRLLLPVMVAAKKGHIFNICSIASLNAYPNGGAYGISKYAMYGFSKNLREEMKPHGIKVTHVLPGAAFTDSWSGSDIDPKRIMEAADIAKMVYAAAHLSPQACVEEIILRPQLGDL